MALTTNSTEHMQTYNSNHHNGSPLTKTQESLRLSNVRGTNQVSYTTSTRRVPLRYAFFEQKSHTPFAKKFVQPQVLCEKASRCPDKCEPACNVNSLVSKALEEKEANPVDKKEAKLVDTKMGNTFQPKHKFDFEYSFKQYLSQVECIKRKKIDSYDTKESSIKRRKINTIDKEANPNKSVPELQNFNTETENDSLAPKLILFNNRYYRSERKDRITHLKRSESTKVVAHEKNVAVMKVGAENCEELQGVDLRNYFDILDEPVVKRNIKTHETSEFDAPLNSKFKVVRRNFNNFAFVPATNNEAKVHKNFSLNGMTKINKRSHSTFKDVKMSNNKVNVIPITNVKSNIEQNNYSHLNIVPITKPETVLDLFSVSEVPKRKNVPNANSKGVEVNFSDLNTVTVMNSEAILDHFIAKKVPKNNGAWNDNFKVDPVTGKAALVDKNCQENEMPKSKDTKSINFKVIQTSSDNFTVVPVTNNEAALDHNLVGNEASKCETAQDVNFKINEETSDSGVFMDHFTVDSEDNINEANENSLFANRFNDFTIDEFDINLDFLNETKDDFKVNFDQLINMDVHSDANKSTSVDTNQDSKRNCNLTLYSALEEFNSFINF